MKWKPTDYNPTNPPKFKNWRRPALIYPCREVEQIALRNLKKAFDPLPPYKQMETQAIENNALVEIPIPVPDGYIAFLENTAEQCTSPQTKHSQAGMQGARHWVQRVDTPEGMFQRLMDGYGISLMFGERCHQYIRNSNNWRAVSGVQLDIDVFRDEKHPEAPEPVYSLLELFDRYPLLPRICTFLIPSASSLFEGRPFKARGSVLFPEPITDMRILRAFGDILCGELDCIPRNVTKNPVAVGFGNTHNAPDAVLSDEVERAWIAAALQQATHDVRSKAKKRHRERQQKAKLNAHYRQNRTGDSEGENISAFIQQCDPVAEMVRSGHLTPGRGNEYHWHESEHARSCDILDGSIHIFSHSMFDASPHQNINEAVGAHRFYLYRLSGLDLTRDADKPRIREFLFERGYGSDPKAFAKKQQAQGIRKPVKLQNLPKYEKVIETLQNARSFLKEVFTKGARFFGLRTDTGTGKTESAITYAMTRDVVLPTQSHTLSSEVVQRATDKEIYAWDYRGIGYHPPEGEALTEVNHGVVYVYDADGYLSCIQSERFEILRNRGFNPYKFVCDGCPAYVECKAVGYLSNPDRARQAQLLALPFPTAFLDPRLRSWADLYKPRGRDTLILHDDLPIGSLFIEYRLTADRLRRIYSQWKGTLAAEWAEACLMALNLRDWERLKSISLLMNDDEKQSARYALTQCIDPATGAVVEPDDYLKSEQVDFSTAEACLKLPQVDKEGYDVATMLEAFFTRYPRVEDAPFTYEAKTETFTFYLPPKPYIFNKTLRFGFAAATLQETLIKRIFPDIHFYDANATEWGAGAGVFQLRTNRNPRATVLKQVEKYRADGEKVWEYDGLNATGEFFFQQAIDFIKAHPNDLHGVLSYQSVIEAEKESLDARGVRTAHFGNLAGLDEAFDGVKYFHILFCPFVAPFDVDFLCRELFGNDETPLIRDADGHLERNEDGTFTDVRAQQVNDALVVGELTQAIGRARLNLYPNQVFLWTSLFIAGVSNRTETVLFDEVDWKQAGNDIEKLRETVVRRQTAEHNGDVRAYAEATGQSQRTAERQTQQARKQSKAELKHQAVALYAEGKSYREIADILDKAPNTIKNWCQSSDF